MPNFCRHHTKYSNFLEAHNFFAELIMCPLVINSITHLTPVHIDNITNAKKYMSFVRKVVDHLPFLTTAGYFRIAASVLFITYLGTFGFVPIGVFWISLLFIGYKKFRLDMNPLCTCSWHVFTNPEFCICYWFFEREKIFFLTKIHM